MSDEELIRNASHAAGEPLGDVSDGDELGELTHAIAVLKGATVESDPARMSELQELTADQARIVHLGHFAAAAVVFFCIGLVVLFKVGFTPPMNPIPVATANTSPLLNNEPDDKPDPPPQVYDRPSWITQQAVVVANTQVIEDGPPAGGIGMGGGTGGVGPSSGSAGGSSASGARYAFTVFKPQKAPEGMTLKKEAMIRNAATGNGFDVFRQEYEGNGRVLLVLQAAENSESVAGLNPTGLQGNAFGVIRNGTVVLLLSNSLTTDELQKIGNTLVELH